MQVIQNMSRRLCHESILRAIYESIGNLTVTASLVYIDTIYLFVGRNALYRHIVYFGITASRSSEVVGNADADMCVAPLKQTDTFQGNQLFQSVDHDSVLHIIAVEHPTLYIREATMGDIGCRHLRIANLQQCFQGQICLYQCILVKNDIYILRIVVGQDDRFRQVIGTDRKIQRLPVAPHDKLIQFRAYHRTVVPDTMPNDRNDVIASLHTLLRPKWLEKTKTYKEAIKNNPATFLFFHCLVL